MLTTARSVLLLFLIAPSGYAEIPGFTRESPEV